MRNYLIGGIAVGLGAALVWKAAHRRKAPRVVEQVEHWSTTTRVVTGAIGGGLVYYASRTPTKMGRIAMAAGTGLMLRSLTDQPVRKLSDVVQVRALLGA